MWAAGISSSLSNAVASSSRVTLQGVSVVATRAASTFAHLGDLRPAKGSTKDNTRYGRGQASGKGGTSGRGHKGQKARSGNGKPTPGYEGGQTPLHRLFPKRGVVNFTARTFAPLNLDKLQEAILASRIDPSVPIGIGSIVRSNIIHGLSGFAGVKLLGQANPELPLPPLTMELSRYSKSAAKAITDAGGKVTAVYHNKLGLRQEVWPEKFQGREVELAKPTRKADIKYYSDPKKFGYLASETQPVTSNADEGTTTT